MGQGSRAEAVRQIGTTGPGRAFAVSERRPFHPVIAAADPLPGLLADPAVTADRGALVDAAQRHHCYELYIGFTHLGWNVWTGDAANLAATARRLSEVLDRGPLRLPVAR